MIILIYHDVVDDHDSHPNPIDPIYSVSLKAFRSQMGFLAAGQCNVISLSQFLALQQKRESLPPRTVIITFDDGFESCHRHALPVMQEWGLKGEFFLTVDLLNRPGYLSIDQARMLVQAEMGIGSHLMHHVFLDDLDLDQARFELSTSRELLRTELSTSIDFLAPPGGRITPAIEKMAAEIGYRGICNSKGGANLLGRDPFRLRRIPIVRSTSLESFRSIVYQQRAMMWYQTARSGVLDLAKSWMGNRRYELTRKKLLGWKDAH